MKVKIIGAGSIGNHLAQASRRIGWDVSVVDKSPEALERMKDNIYLSRYGSWDREIKLYTMGKEPKGGFDIIMVGTPPDVRMRVALECLKEKPRVLQLEKPLCEPFNNELREFIREYDRQPHTVTLIGYDHAVSPSIRRVVSLLELGVIGEVITVDVEFREHWQGIFKAHPWLSGPEDSYLGYWSRGGGASGEHSHALHLWQYLAQKSGAGVWEKVSAVLKIKRGRADSEYDSLAAFSLVTDRGIVGRVIQDVVTLPTRKWARIQGDKGFIEWHCGGSPKGDIVRYSKSGGAFAEETLEKSRPDDFYEEVLHIRDILDGTVLPEKSPLAFKSGVSVMSVLETVWKNHGMTGLVPIWNIT